MILRAVFVTIASGKTADYWDWAREIVALWNAHGIKRHGGPFAGQEPGGADTALWLTLHESEQAAAEEFRSMYSEPAGRALLDRRPPLVSTTTLENYSPFEAKSP